MDSKIYSGQTDVHIEYRTLCLHNGDRRSVGLQTEAWLKYDQLYSAAAEQGINLMIASGFRDFDRQLTIWNGKASGRRRVLDDHGVAIDTKDLSDKELSHAILRWSALPGASRHHWGSDLDVYDAASIDSSYQVQLTPEEYASSGPFARLSQWLTDLQDRGDESSFGFFRPYLKDTGGIAPEAWHLSYAPIASQCQRHWGALALRQCLADSDISLKKELMAELDTIFERFVRVNPSLYPAAFRSALA